MHEIPNLPFPSLHVPEQTTTQQAGAQQPEPKKPLNAARLTTKSKTPPYRPCGKR